MGVLHTSTEERTDDIGDLGREEVLVVGIFLIGSHDFGCAAAGKLNRDWGRYAASKTLFIELLLEADARGACDEAEDGCESAVRCCGCCQQRHCRRPWLRSGFLWRRDATT